MSESIDKIKVARGITKFIAGQSVGMVATKLIKTHVPTATRSEELQLIVGAYVLGAMVSERAVDWTGNRFDKTVETIQNVKNLFNKEEAVEE